MTDDAADAQPAAQEAQPSVEDERAAWRDVRAERQRQINVEGWTPEHDDEHDSGDLAAAASAYALAACDCLNPYSQGDGGWNVTGGESPPMWPQEWEWKPADPRRMLVKAGALILAEIERIDRAALARSQRDEPMEPKDPPKREARMTDRIAELMALADKYALAAIEEANGHDWSRPERAALESALRDALDGWQPIATAPKDGRTLLLGYFNSHGKWRTMRGQWMSADYIAENWEEPDNGVEGWHETSVEADETPNCWYTEPTHWMPLPAAPSAKLAQGKKG